ncbi:LytTR family DNA-binding domain-containing protein [uncultured Algibacter sp.]|uniref:LytR/AlgR family response regulator transcription factor n=1 Tax=uncultured Algibacter sp. TaxID=298659 RepID=UPI0032165A95
MNTISCFIVEDDPQAYAYAASIIKAYGAINIIGYSDTIKEAAIQIKKLKPDFIVLDVFLTDGDAFEFLALFKNIEFRIIFTTSFAKYAIEAFKFSALDYLLKPYQEEDLISALDKVKHAIDNTNHQSQINTLLHNINNKDQSQKLILKNADAIHVVDIQNILFAKSDNNYTTFVITNSKDILISKPLKSFENKLNGHNFFRVHQSFLINLAQISSFDKRHDEVILKQHHNIPVAQSRKKNLMDYIDQLF